MEKAYWQFHIGINESRIEKDSTVNQECDMSEILGRHETDLAISP